MLLFIPTLVFFAGVFFVLRIKRMGARKAFFSSIGASIVVSFFSSACGYGVIYFSAPRTSYVVETLPLVAFPYKEKTYFGFERFENPGATHATEFFLFSEEHGTLRILEYRHTDIREVIREKRTDACLERCRSKFIGWAAVFTGRSDSDFLRLRVPENGLAHQGKNDRFVIIPE
jgi:hypothetical protein